MDEATVVNLKSGFETAYINENHKSKSEYKPQFVLNDHTKSLKVLSAIEKGLLNCKEFSISVAFISFEGFLDLSGTLEKLEEKGIRGRILTTDYLCFSDPAALDRFARFKNIELKMYHVKEDVGFHTKGYLFKEEGFYRIIIGSANMTGTALTTNMEWNTEIISSEQGEMAQQIVNEFETLWNDDASVKYEDFIELYRDQYRRRKQIDRLVKKQQENAIDGNVIDYDTYKLTPNEMQERFVCNVHDLIEMGEKKALLISATGTGKTYASAFAMRNENPKKALFIVHRELIAKQAAESYRKVFGKNVNIQVLSGNSKNYDADILFATMSMMAKDETLSRYKSDEFDWICIDEVHRAGSKSYQKIMDYFDPKFWLGMTASPERTDGFDIYKLFDNNIADEIRLQQAMKEKLLCHFHYFGISELEIEGVTADDKNNARNFTYLLSDRRVEHILQKAEFYGYSGDRLKGLIFCSSKSEAKELSDKFNRKGYFTDVLVGEDSERKREETIELLTKEISEEEIALHENNIKDRVSIDESHYEFLDYIFTIDIFNEGVDIPEINQVIMLRPTESPIIFVQQLGRGLRKADNKEFVNVLDFIGNYNNNYMIPMALSDDRSYNKDSMRRYIAEGTRIIPGASTIQFDEISKKRIYASIDSARTNQIALLKSSFEQLRFRVGRIPKLMEFKKYGSIDVNKYFEKCGSYYNFLVNYYSDDYDIRLSVDEATIVEFLSKKVTNMKREHELVLLKRLISQDDRVLTYVKEIMKNEYKLKFNKEIEESVYNNLTNKFAVQTEREKYYNCDLIVRVDGGYELNNTFRTMLNRNSDFKAMVNEILDYGIDKIESDYSDLYADTNFQLYQKYTMEDVCRLLNWKKNINGGAIGGYFYDKNTKTLPVFINYEKDEDAIGFKDRFFSNESIIALSKEDRKSDSADANHIYKRTSADKNNKIYLFVRKNKNDNETKEYYFLGEVCSKGEPEPVVMEKSGKDAFEITYQLDVPVREDIYEYIVEEAI